MAKPAAPTSASSTNDENYDEFVLSTNKDPILSIMPVVKGMDVKSASTLLSDSKQLRDRVQNSGGARIYKGDNKSCFIATADVLRHTDNKTSLKRLTAAAGLYYASKLKDDKNFLNTAGNDALSSLAEGHGLSGLKVEDPIMYFLYNIGLQYELEDSDHVARVSALLAWQALNRDILFKSSRIGISSRPHDYFGAAGVQFENICGTDEKKWDELRDQAIPHMDKLAKYKATRDGGGTTRART